MRTVTEQEVRNYVSTNFGKDVVPDDFDYSLAAAKISLSGKYWERLLEADQATRDELHGLIFEELQERFPDALGVDQNLSASSWKEGRYCRTYGASGSIIIGATMAAGTMWNTSSWRRKHRKDAEKRSVTLKSVGISLDKSLSGNSYYGRINVPFEEGKTPVEMRIWSIVYWGGWSWMELFEDGKKIGSLDGAAAGFNIGFDVNGRASVDVGKLL